MRSARLLYSSDAAQLLGVSQSTIVRWADQGLIPMVRYPGGPQTKRRFRREDIEAFKRRCTFPATEEEA